ncbi:unnamed protein product [Didymodactylos carnosus]|uniref:Uncharacterized protein n=1 Tax=Didymodactylos carnosus TaxID=1234261 RepID=A0A815JG35_9BILA|nr:unnamed protein product [Didymodactylos carnosus]CAF1377453.1 unnamed protein product [Didymodactylos carnosus]CAF3995412.1 unnamed protein product [Didymodactylos carnosus]CAF4269220.1 unnamed protein product [Didymodactylos carnosus]
MNDSHQPVIDAESSGTECTVRTLTGDLLCVKEFTPIFSRMSAYLACANIDNSHPKHIYFQPTPDHVLSVDYSDWLDSAVLCDSNVNQKGPLTTSKNESINNDCDGTYEKGAYSELIKKYSLNINACCESNFVSKQDDFSKAGSYSPNALHKTRFNPNLGSHTWCAAGGESGLLILLPLTRACATIADLHYKEENKH